MKKIFLLVTLMATFAMTSMAQSNNVPKPCNPDIWEYWEATNYHAEADTTYYLASLLFQVWQDFDGYYADETWDYMNPDSYIRPDNIDQVTCTYSIYTDFDKLFVFTTEDFPDEASFGLELPTTEIPHGYVGMEFIEPEVYFHRNTKTPGNPLFKWRIGMQLHYYIDGEKNSSDIVYWDVNKWGDLNEDGDVNVMDITELIDIIMNSKDNILADLNDDGDVNVIDITALIDAIMNEPPF